MGAQSVTGTGAGAANKPTVAELAILNNGPQIIFAGRTNAASNMSPPSSNTTVRFPYALPNGADDYVVTVTSINGGKAYVAAMDENDDGEFIGFTALAETECTVMYTVCKIGSRPNV